MTQVISASGQARLSDVTIGMPWTTSPIALSSTTAIERGASGMTCLPLVGACPSNGASRVRSVTGPDNRRRPKGIAIATSRGGNDRDGPVPP